MKHERRDALLILTFGLSLFGAAGTAVSFIRWLGLDAPLQQLSVAIAALPPLEILFAVLAFLGPIALIVAAFVARKRNAPTDASPN